MQSTCVVWNSFFFFWLWWVFVAVRVLSLVAVCRLLTVVASLAAEPRACAVRVLSLVVVCRLLTVVVSLVAEPRACNSSRLSSCSSWALEHRLSSCGTRALLLTACGTFPG